MTVTLNKFSQASEDCPKDRLLSIQGGWEHFKLIQRGCEASPGIKLFYFEGTIEILMPGRSHEKFSHAMGVLLTLFLAHQGILFLGVGSADQEKEGVASAQPDQSYCIGGEKAVPDLSVEVVFTSGNIAKLKRYQAIGVPEVWFWEDGVLELYHLGERGYERIEQSRLPGLMALDLAVFERHVLMAETDLGEAVRSFNRYLLEQ
ncbi:MAG: Uma2 family endonuclease [Cyanosarcina radialis HA8281-LM2]|jgi:Uma2 family endonuclease|nr:Uma2 family endonuclease [Cyanosarcina radialis HA8281-LM2]